MRVRQTLIPVTRTSIDVCRTSNVASIICLASKNAYTDFIRGVCIWIPQAKLRHYVENEVLEIGMN